MALFDSAIQMMKRENEILNATKHQLLSIFKTEDTPGHKDIMDAIRSISAAIGVNEAKLLEAELLNEE